MEQFKPQIKKPEQNFDKEYFGKEFKSILEKNAKYYDETLAEINRGVAGEEFSKANRNSFILRSTINDFIKIPNFPEKNRKELFQKLAFLDFNNPMSERIGFYTAEKVEYKNTHAENHNNKMELYRSSVKNLLESLYEVLPKEMCDELLLRNDMFADLLKWVDMEFNNENK